ncbi:hypothetical protein EDB84DRAFT_1612031 [Lactarius hengduanensis]|nr:hypothetical protein EDB84DRAFT_1612031 [Lactarius hengduanensis]
MLSLMKDQPSETHEDPVLGSRINDLLRTCVPGISPLPEQLRRKPAACLHEDPLVFRKRIQSTREHDSIAVLCPHRLREPRDVPAIQSEDDSAAHLIGRCFSSLVARKLTQDIQSRTGRQVRVDPAELSCLAAILSKTSPEVVNLLRQPGEIGLANIASLMSSETVVKGAAGSTGHIPKDTQHPFRDVPPNAELPPDLVAALHETTPLGQRSRVLDLQVDRLRQIMEGSSVVHGKPEVTTFAMTELEPGSGSAAAINTTYIVPIGRGLAVQDTSGKTSRASEG